MKSFFKVPLVAAVSLTLLILEPTFAADLKKNGKANFFVEASRYSVKIKARVKYPFINDSRGSRSGAGFLIDKKRGWVLTNKHVSGHRPESLRIMFKNRAYVDATLLYTDRLLDFAIIKFPVGQIPSSATEALLDCTTKPTIGENVGAFGHPFSLAFSGTRGIVSGNRERGGRSWVQTDAPINSGNSGGPLINLSTGRVIGINTSSLSKSSSEGISFAVPMVHACRVIEILKKGENPSPPYLPLAFSKKPNHDDGLVVSYVYRKQPVAWPLKVDDEVLGVVGGKVRRVRNQGELLHELRGLKGSAQILLKRNGKDLTVPVALIPRPQPNERVGVYVSGMIIAPFPLRDDEFQNLNNAMMVHHARRASAARMAGAQKWDYLVNVDNKIFSDPVRLCRYLKNLEAQEKNVNIRLRRFKSQYVSFTEFVLIKLKSKSVKLIGNDSRHRTCDGL